MAGICCPDASLLSWIWIITTLCTTGNVAMPLNGVIQHYEPIHFDSEVLIQDHHRARRETDGVLRLTFHAFHKHFRLQLRRDHHVFTPDVVFDSSAGPIEYDTSGTYSGVDEDDVMGKAHGVVTSVGAFEGQLLYPNETFYIESSRRHFDKKKEFNSVIYRASDVSVNVHDTVCKSDELHKKMAKYRKLDENESSRRHEERENWSDRYRGSGRQRRAIDPTKTICQLYLKADHTFYNKFYQSHEAVIEQMTNHVVAANNIFKLIDFDKDGSPDDVQFQIKRTTVYNDSTAAGYLFPLQYSVEKLLDLFSQENYDDYCLVILFSYRDFSNGVLGLAWTAATGLAGGVCEIYRTYQGESKSLNTALVTMLNYGKDVSSSVSYSTFAHEIGHNFGSQHDPEATGSCSPGTGSGGNFIMFPMATSGFETNNNVFSTCSVDYIGPILETAARDAATGCFKVPSGSICGNNVVEAGEECDCGWEGQCTEACCNPQTGVANATLPCTKVNVSASSCSPSQGPCCSPSCVVYTAGANHECRPATSCLASAKCDGSSTTCPASTSAANGTACAEGKVCFMGECSGSVCIAEGMVSCQCSPTVANNWKDAKLCEVCCMYSSVCTPSTDIPSINTTKALAGSACNDYKGYCDVFQVCRQVDPTGPLLVLKNLLLKGEIFMTLKTFLTKYWYVGIAGGVVFIIIMILVAKFCSKRHGPPQNKVDDNRRRNFSDSEIDMHTLRRR